jgi:anaerobic selenocysteine-containing dehydrogenase
MNIKTRAPARTHRRRAAVAESGARGATPDALRMPPTVHLQCTLCEAHCGIESKSTATACCGSRAATLPEGGGARGPYADENRLRRPVRRVGSEWEEIGWHEALDMAADETLPGARMMQLCLRHTPASACSVTIKAAGSALAMRGPRDDEVDRP